MSFLHLDDFICIIGMKEINFQHINFISITSKLSCCVSWSGRKIQKQILSIATYTFNTCESVCYCILIRGQKTKVRSFCRIKICFLFQRLSERIICLYLKASNLLLNWIYFLFTNWQNINSWNTSYYAFTIWIIYCFFKIRIT